MAFQLKDGKFLLVDGKFAIDTACCCGGVCCASGTCYTIDDFGCGSDCSDCGESCSTICTDWYGGIWHAGKTCAAVDCTEGTGACCDHGTCTRTTFEACTGVYQGDGTSCSPTNPCSSCDTCAFYNPADGRYYLQITHHVVADFSNTGTSETAHLDSTKVSTCSGGVITDVCSGSGNYDRSSDGCSCTEVVHCGTAAAGSFWSLGGTNPLISGESCNHTVCRSALTQTCVTTPPPCNVTTDTTTYSMPCVAMGGMASIVPLFNGKFILQ